MRFRSHFSRSVLLGFSTLGLFSALAYAQQVPKALPYVPGQPLPNQGNPRVLPPSGVIPARPVPGTRPAPLVRRPSQVAPQPRQQPPAPQPTGDPQDDLYTYASLAFSNGYYDVAADRLTTYIQTYPNGKDLEAAHFRLGESRLKLGDKAGASVAYDSLLKRFPKGEFTALAAYRLASLNYQIRDLPRALSFFTIAERASHERKATLAAKAASAAPADKAKANTVSEENAKLWLSSAYYRAYCLQATGEKADALQAYRSVADLKTNNEYRPAALRELARLATETGNEDAALEALGELADQSGNRDLKAEALIKTALIHSDNEQPDKAKPLLEEALKLKPEGYLGAVANYTLLQILYQEEDYAGAAGLYGSVEITELPEHLRPKLLMTVANAQRKRQLYVRAIEGYSTIEEYYEDSDEAVEAGYLKLICFYKIKDRDLPEFVDRYAINMAKRSSKKYVDRALLLRAEHYFRGADFLSAAKSYSQIDPDAIPEEVRASMLYNRGWCESEAGEHKQAAKSLTRFLEEFPNHQLTSSVYATRALSYRASGNPASALEDLAHIIEHHPDSAASELAHQQVGLIKSEQQDWQGVIDGFSALIENFPNSIAVSEAHYYRGRAHFELKQFDKAVPDLKAAIAGDASYFQRAQMRIVLANYFLQNADELAEEIDRFLAKDEDANIDPKVLSWLGARYFEDGDYDGAAKYLRLGVTPERPASTLPVVWIYLAEAESKSGHHEEAVEAVDFYLDLTKHPSSRARGFLVKAEALLRADRLDEANESAREGLQLQKEGRINAQLLIAQGDIAVGEAAALDGGPGSDKAYAAAAGKYVIVSEIFIDPVITPTALSRAADTFDKAGDPEKAGVIRADLNSRFPEFEE